MDFQLWVAYFLACWMIAISPGSGAVLSMTHGLAYGVRKTSATIAGLEAGVAVLILVAGAGVGAVLLASATAFTAVKLIGAAYLIWLGCQQWRSRVGVVPTAGGAPTTPLEASVPNRRQRFLLGLLTNVTNPKGIVFNVAVLPQFINPSRPLALQLLVLLVTALAVDTVVMHGYAFLASRAQRWMGTARARRAQNRVFGGVLVAMGASLLLVKRTAG